MKYLLIWINVIEKDRVDNNKYIDIKKGRNKIVKILNKLKSRNMSNFRFRYLPKSKEIQSSSTIKKFQLFIPNARVVFIEVS